MQIQWKIVLLVGCTVAGTVAAVVWKSSSLIRVDRAELISTAAAKQLAPVRRLVKARLDVVKSELVQFAIRKEASNISPSSFGSFDAVALVFENPGKAVGPKWVDKQTGSKAAGWPTGYDLTLLNSLPYAKLKDGELLWVRRADKDERVVFTVMVPVEVQMPIAKTAPTLPPGTPTVAGAQSGGVAESLPEGTTDSGASGIRRGIVVGFTSANPLASVTEDFIGSMHKVFVADEQGYIASHTNKSYNGTLFSEDQMVKALKSSQRIEGSLSYEDLDSQKVDGRWERVEGTNLFAAVSTPRAFLAGSSDRIILWMAMIGGASFIVAIFLAVWMGAQVSAGIQRMGKYLIELQAGNYQPGFLDTKAADEVGFVSSLLVQMEQGRGSGSAKSGGIGLGNGGGNGNAGSAGGAPGSSHASGNSQSTPVASQGAREEIYRQMARGLALQLKEPIAAILGHVQLMRGKTNAGETETHAQSIERDARNVKACVDMLTRFAGEDAIDMQPTSLSQLVETVLSSVERELSVAKVKVQKNIDEDAPLINASAVHLQAALREMILRAAEAMKNRPKKELQIRLSLKNGKPHLQISDTSVGLDNESKAKLFDPFFVAYPHTENPGLGLAMSRAILERHLAYTTVSSMPGAGTTVEITFAPSSKQKLNADSSAVAISMMTTALSSSANSIPDAPSMQTFSGVTFDTSSGPQTTTTANTNTQTGSGTGSASGLLLQLDDEGSADFPAPPPFPAAVLTETIDLTGTAATQSAGTKSETLSLLASAETGSGFTADPLATRTAFTSDDSPTLGGKTAIMENEVQLPPPPPGVRPSTKVDLTLETAKTGSEVQSGPFELTDPTLLDLRRTQPPKDGEVSEFSLSSVAFTQDTPTFSPRTSSASNDPDAVDLGSIGDTASDNGKGMEQDFQSPAPSSAKRFSPPLNPSMGAIDDDEDDDDNDNFASVDLSTFSTDVTAKTPPDLLTAVDPLPDIDDAPDEDIGDAGTVAATLTAGTHPPDMTSTRPLETGLGGSGSNDFKVRIRRPKTKG